MTSPRPPSPRLAPPVHPTIRRQSDTQTPHTLSPSPLPSMPLLSPGPPPLPSRPSSSSISPSPTPLASSDTIPEELPIVNEEELTEAQLRQLYDEEEVDRFLRLFSDYIREVKIPQIQPIASAGSSLNNLNLDAEADEEGSSWISPGAGVNPQGHSQPSTTEGLAEWVAFHVAPYLPPEAPLPPPLTVRSVRLLIHRALVIILHTYVPMISRGIQLASWKEPKITLRYCLLYWFLWYHDLLLAGLIVRTGYSLIRRKFLPYPTLAELRQRRNEEERADDLTKKLITRLAISPAEHVMDLWGSFKEYRAKKKGDAGLSSPEPSPAVPEIVVEDAAIEKDAEVVAEDHVLTQDDHIYGPIFELGTKLADVHERIRNLFLWRRPRVSTIFAFVLLSMFFVSLLPTKYLVKLVTFSVGVLFWHVMPVIAALPRRLPPPLDFSPTDAEYAMDLISQRVALGLPVQVRKPKKRDKGTHSNNSSESLLATGSKSAPEEDVDWGKWKGKLDGVQVLSGNVVSSFKDGSWKDPQSWLSKTKLVPAASKGKIQTYTYPAQCKSPGLVTLTDDQLLFTPLHSLSPTIKIDLKALIGVKRSGIAKGLKLRWTEVQEDGTTTEREERFLWVAGRDELFARLVGSQSGRWLHS